MQQSCAGSALLPVHLETEGQTDEVEILRVVADELSAADAVEEAEVLHPDLQFDSL